jgi:hypothetical protein
MGKSTYLHMNIPDKDVSWKKEMNKKFKYHLTVSHKPTGITIEQAGEKNWIDVKELCLNSLKWKLHLLNTTKGETTK